MKVRATYAGENGSMGYQTGKTYDLEILGDRVIKPFSCPYTVAGFLKTWRYVEFIRSS